MKTSIPYSHQQIDGRDIREVVRTLRSEWITQGPAVQRFEHALCAYTGARYALAVSSGTAALHCACLALAGGADDEIITSPLTFVASANCALYCGYRPVFAEVDGRMGNIDCSDIEEKITSRTRAIIPVHFSGLPCDMRRLRRIARKHKLAVIEDAAHALGAQHCGSPVGSCAYSDMTIFSFHPVKTVTTGEGGAILTNSRRLYAKLCLVRNHGITKERFSGRPDGAWYYEMQQLGFNYRMTDIQAALGVSQVKKVDLFVAKRRNIAAVYDRAFTGNDYFDLPVGSEEGYSSRHLYQIRLKDPFAAKRREIFATLRRQGIGAQVHYIPVYLQPYYQALGYKRGLCPAAEDFYRRVISIPIYPAMTRADSARVIRTVLRVFKQYQRRA